MNSVASSLLVPIITGTSAEIAGAAGSNGPDGRPDTLVNHCTEGTAFYTCEQVVNGKSLALIVFTATDDPTKFHTQPVLQNGRAIGISDRLIGEFWTWGLLNLRPAPAIPWQAALPP